MGRWQRGDRDVDRAVPLTPAQPVRDALHGVRHIDGRGLQLLAAEARESEEVVDQLAHSPGVLVDDAQEALRLGLELGAVILEENTGEAVYGSERRPQVVGDGVGERLQ